MNLEEWLGYDVDWPATAAMVSALAASVSALFAGLAFVIALRGRARPYWLAEIQWIQRSIPSERGRVRQGLSVVIENVGTLASGVKVLAHMPGREHPILLDQLSTQAQRAEFLVSLSNASLMKFRTPESNEDLPMEGDPTPGRYRFEVQWREFPKVKKLHRKSWTYEQ